METGILQRRWAETCPPAYDKETRIVCMDIQPETRPDENGNPVEGFSFFQVEIDPLMDYGHIKSQLIEAGFAQKDEFGLLMNSVDDIIVAVREAGSWTAFKSGLNTDAINKFVGFCEFRAMCAQTAHNVVDNL